MINFACRCSHRFTVEDDRAGESLQCPACGLLVDVPTIDDLPGLRDDGSYEFGDQSAGNPNAGAKAMRSTPSPMQKESADRRLSLKEFLNIGTNDDDLLEIRDEVKAGVPKHPKYDPETGELIVPLDVRREIRPAPVMALPVTLSYEHKSRSDAPNIFSPFLWMFQLPNLVACAVVSLVFLLTFVLTSSGFLLVFSPVLVVMLIAHYANVVDETGPTGNDEIPALLRSAHLFDDFLRPCCQVVGAYLLMIAPIILVNLYVIKLHPSVDLGLSIFLHLMIPAVLLTMITSGAFNNLLPSRIFSVIMASGWHYWVVTLTGYVSISAMFFAIYIGAKCGGTVFHIMFNGPISSVPALWGSIPIKLVLALSPLVTFVAMYLVHVYAWQLGLLYRLHHDRFNWVWQKHTSERTDTQAQLHTHRQHEQIKKAERARASIEKRAAQKGSLPVAKRVEPPR